MLSRPRATDLGMLHVPLALADIRADGRETATITPIGGVATDDVQALRRRNAKLSARHLRFLGVFDLQSTVGQAEQLQGRISDR